MGRTFTASIAAVLILLAAIVAFAQGIGEYGRAVGGVAARKGNTAPVGGKSLAPPAKNPKSIEQGVSGVETRAMPALVTVRSTGVSLYARSDELADKITPLVMGEKLTPLLEAVGVDALWYMVKTDAGMTGWIKSADVESGSNLKP